MYQEIIQRNIIDGESWACWCVFTCYEHRRHKEQVPLFHGCLILLLFLISLHEMGFFCLFQSCFLVFVYACFVHICILLTWLFSPFTREDLFRLLVFLIVRLRQKEIAPRSGYEETIKQINYEMSLFAWFLHVCFSFICPTNEVLSFECVTGVVPLCLYFLKGMPTGVKTWYSSQPLLVTVGPNLMLHK